MILLSTLSPLSVPTIEYYGWDVVDFWYRQLADRYFEYSWQVRTAYVILLLNIITMVVLTVLFGRQVYRRRQEEKAYHECEERFRDAFRAVIESPVHWSVERIETECGCSVAEMRQYKGSTLSRLICNIRLRMADRVYLPNVQLLCELTSVRDTLEDHLKRGMGVEQTLQLIDTLSLRISEGRLAVYTNHRDHRIRRMARLCLSLCTDSDPFRYLQEDLEERVTPSQLMSLHRLFGYLHTTHHQMPSFLTIASRLKNDRSAAFMIEEVAYWGNDNERKSLSQFYLSDRIACRLAAMRAVAFLCDASQEDALIATYSQQPEEVQMEILHTVTVLATGHQTAFLEKAYIAAPSKRLAERALSCLYRYGQSGHESFEQLRMAPLDRRSRSLLDQIESMGLLEEKRHKSQGAHHHSSAPTTEL